MKAIKLLEEDLAYIVRRLPKSVEEVLQTNNVILGGGFLRSCILNEDVQDIDLFVSTEAVGQAVSSTLKHAEQLKYPNQVYTSANAITLRTKPYTMQVITRWLFTNAEDLIASFDYTMASACIWYNHSTSMWDSLCDDRYYQDLASKRLVYRNPTREEEAGGSMLRMLKFLKRGYSISPENCASVMARVHCSINPNEYPAPLNSEADWTKAIAGRLREVDPLETL